jgi:hypothetical protein
MNTNRTQYIRVAAPILGAGFILIVLMVTLASAHTRAASPQIPVNDDPDIKGITVTAASIAISDTHPGTDVSRMVYFSNAVSGGIITLTFEISGTPTLTLTAGAAFSEPERIYTATSSPLITDVVYMVSTTHSSQNHVVYTVANGVSTTVAITYVRDIAPPEVHILQPPADYFTDTQLVITGTAEDGSGAGVQWVRVTTGTTWSMASTMPAWVVTTVFPVNTDGKPYTITAQAKDYLGILGKVTQVITVDNKAPTGTVVFTSSLPVDRWVSTPTLDIQWGGFTDGDGITGYQYLVSSTAIVTLPSDSGAFTTSTRVTGTLGNGQWYFNVAAKDDAGNWSTTHYTGTFQVDTTAPTATISTPKSGAVLTTSVLPSIPITGTAEDTMSGVSVVQVTTGTGWVTAETGSPWCYTWMLPLTDNGVYTLRARVTDTVGLGSTSDSVTVTVDTIRPLNPGVVTTTNGIVTGTWIPTSTIPVTWSQVTDGSGVTYYYTWTTISTTVVGAGSPFTTTTAVTGTGLPNGDNYFHIRTQDGAGNWATQTVHLGPFKVDTLSPTVSISTPVPAAWITTTHLLTDYVITGTAKDAGSGLSLVQVSTATDWVTAGMGSPWFYTWTLPITDSVVYTLRAQAHDNVNNVGASPDVTVTVDTVVPDNPDSITTANSIVTGTWILTSTVPVTWNLGDDGSGEIYYYTWTTAGTTEVEADDSFTTTPPVTGTNLSEGDNWFHLRTRDGAGNWTTDTLHVGPFKVDTGSPTVTISTPRSGAVLTTSVLPGIPITGTAEDAISGVNVVEVTTGTVWITVTEVSTETWGYYSWTLPITDNVVYTLTARVTDTVGLGSTSDRVTVTVDTVRPRNPGVVTTTNHVMTGTWIPTNTVPMTWWDLGDDGSGEIYYYTWTTTSATEVEVGVGVGVLLTRTPPVTGTNLSEGDNWFHLRTRDGAGNWTTDTLHVGPFKVDITRPTVTITAPTSGAVLTTSLSGIFITGAAGDALSGVDVVKVTTGTAWITTTGVGTNTWGYWYYSWTLPIIDNEVYTLTAQVTDTAGMSNTSDDVTIIVDTVAPTAAVPLDAGDWSITSTLVFTWPHSDDEADIAGYYIMVISNSNDVIVDDEFVTTTAYTLTGAVEGVTYTARIKAKDRNGNVGKYGGISNGIRPDLTPPDIWSPSIWEASPYLHAVDTILYYTNTMVAAQTFAVMGNSDDTLSGVDRVTFTLAFGERPEDDTSGFIPWQSCSPDYGVDPGETASGTITATVYDVISNTAIQTYTYELDSTPPEATAWAPPYFTDPTKPIPITYTATDTQSGIYSTTLWYMKESTGDWVPYDTISDGSDTFYFTPSEKGRYLFAAVAVDNVGNQEPTPTSMVSETQTTYDPDVPQSEVTDAPEYRNSPPITMTWIVTRSIADVKEVRLWYRFNAGTWVATNITSAPPSGVPIFTDTFTFYPENGDGIYGFATIAKDDFGKSEAEPPVITDASTIYDTTPPTSTAASPTYENADTISVTYDTNDEVAGVATVTLHYKFGTSSIWTPTGQVLTDTAGTFAFSPTLGDGMYCFQTVATDRAGNEEDEPFEGGDDCTIYDTTNPTSEVITSPAYTNKAPILVTYTASDEVVGIDKVSKIATVTLQYRFDGGKWMVTGYISTAITGNFAFSPTHGDGRYDFRTVATDQVGNKENELPENGDSFTVYDTISPTSQATATLDCCNKDSICVTYLADDDRAGVATVALWYKFDAGGAWTDTGQTSAGNSGAFIFDFTYSNGKYYFQTIATDIAGNREEGPSENGDDFTTYDTITPTSEAASPDYDNEGTIPVTYTANDDRTDIATVTLWYKFGISGAWTDTEQITTTITGTFAFSPTHGDGTYYFQTIATDGATNVEDGPSGNGDALTVYDITSPTVAITAPEHIADTIFVVEWKADAAVSGLRWYDVRYRVGDGEWQDWITETLETSQSFTASGTGKITFGVTAYDNAGNSAYAETVTYVGSFRIYLPLVVRGYPPGWKQGKNTDNVHIRTPSGCGNDIWYAGTYNADVWESTNNAWTWDKLNIDLGTSPYPVVANPDACNQAFVSVWGSGVYRITNNVTSTFNSGLPGYICGLAVKGTTLLYAGACASDRGIYKSDINNANWQQVLDEGDFRHLTVIRNRVYAGATECTLYFDDGTSWPKRIVLPPEVCNGAAIWSIAEAKTVLYAGLEAPHGLYYEADSGWQKVTAIPNNTNTVYGLAYDEANDYLYVSTDGSGIYRCVVDEAGIQECEQCNRGLGTLHMREIQIHNGLLVAGSDDGIWYLPSGHCPCSPVRQSVYSVRRAGIHRSGRY